MYAPTAVMAAVAPVKITVLLLRREVVIMIVCVSREAFWFGCGDLTSDVDYIISNAAKFDILNHRLGTVFCMICIPGCIKTSAE